jgi:hypothetical protein
MLELLIIPHHDLDSDLAAGRIRERLQARHVRRLVIDSATEQVGLTSPERATMFLACLAAYLRVRASPPRVPPLQARSTTRAVPRSFTTAAEPARGTPS